MQDIAGPDNGSICGTESSGHKEDIIAPAGVLLRSQTVPVGDRIEGCLVTKFVHHLFLVGILRRPPLSHPSGCGLFARHFNLAEQSSAAIRLCRR